MTPDRAIQCAVARFPFKGYMIPESGVYRNIADTTLRHLHPGSTILDFGCGPCDKTAVLQILGYECTGYDDLQDDWHRIPANREKILAFAKECGIDFRLAETRTLPFERNHFDMVMAHDVLEHLHDSPRDLLNDLLDLLKPGGLLFITVPSAVNVRKRIDVLRGRTNLPRFDDYYWYPGAWRGHVREFVRGDLVKLSEFLRIEPLELRGCDHMLQKVPGAVRRVYLSVTTIFPGWKDSWTLVARKPEGWTPSKSLPPDELARILGRSTAYSYDRSCLPA